MTITPQSYVDFLSSSPTPYHLENTVLQFFFKNNFQTKGKFNSTENSPNIKKITIEDIDTIESSNYYLLKPNSTLLFLIFVPQQELKGIRTIVTHSDSPVFKMRSNALNNLIEQSDIQNSKNEEKNFEKSNNHTTHNNDIFKLKTIPLRPYGGLLRHTHYDRLFTFSGLIILKTGLKLLIDSFLDIVIPSLPPHLNQSGVYAADGKNQLIFSEGILLGKIENSYKGKIMNERKLFNSLSDNTMPIKEVTKTEGVFFRDSTNTFSKKNEYTDFELTDILSHDLSLTDQQLPVHTNGFIHSARQDNLLSTYAGLMGILNRNENNENSYLNVLLICDNEEIGSLQLEGARSGVIRTVFDSLKAKIRNNGTKYKINPKNNINYNNNKELDNLILSLDVSHTFNPNYANHYDLNHKLLPNSQITIKKSPYYATDIIGESYIKLLCEKLKIKYSIFENKDGIRGGSTVGSMLACLLGDRVVDLGVPIWAMHSVREMACWKDIEGLYQLCKGFFENT